MRQGDANTYHSGDIAVTRVALLVLNTFLGLTAVVGGLGLLLGWYKPPPVELLRGSPFGSYAIPALFLLVVMGGGGLVAAVALLRWHELGVPTSGVVGAMTIGFEVVQMLIIGFSWLQVLYLVVGVIGVLLAVRMWRAGRMPRRIRVR
jgi:hypothetical protein